MKSKGLFPHRAQRSGYRNHSAAGNSSSSNKPGPSSDGYKEGMLGWREGRVAGGQTMSQKLGPARPTDRSMAGDGGLAYDSSAAGAMRDTGKPSR